MPFPVAITAALVKITIALGVVMVTVPMLILLERKLLADFQARIGPNRVGPFGLLQSFADGIKLVAKESILPAHVDRLLYFAAPVLVMIPALSVLAVIPFGPPLRVGEHLHPLVIADLPVAFLFILALTSLSVYGIVLAGWASNNKYSLLGGLRSAAQMVSYELPMALAVVAGLLIASRSRPEGLFSLSLTQVVDVQSGGIWNWVAFDYRFGFLGLLAMIAFYICGLAETNRAPFDLPEAETELIGGYHTEYGGLKWSMFFMGEYAAMLNVSAVTTTLFLGGWHAPYPDARLFPVGSWLGVAHGLFWFLAKIGLIIVLYMWLRATLPRLRYDHLMQFSWTKLLPGTLVLVMATAFILTLRYPRTPPPILAHTLMSDAPAPNPSAPPTMGTPQFPVGPGPGRRGQPPPPPR